MEGIVHDVRPFGKNVPANAFEVHIVKLHVEKSLLAGDASLPHIDPEVATADHSPCRFFGVGSEAHPSRLSESNSMNFANRGNHTVSQTKKA